MQRRTLIRMAEAAIKKKIAPMEMYLIRTHDGNYPVHADVGPRAVFGDGKPLYFHMVCRVEAM